MKKYEVLVAFNSEDGRDVRVRSDVNKHFGFTRFSLPGTKEKFVIHTEYHKGTGNQRVFLVAFEGSESKAKKFADGIKMSYDARGVSRSILCQVEE
jgi:hypothetical protein